MDCRDWIVISADEAGLADEHDGAPVLAVLSSVLVDGLDLLEASGVLSVGLLKDEHGHALPTRPVAPGAVAHELLVDDALAEATRYVMPAPGRQLAVVAEFGHTAHPELQHRIEQLVLSFRWQSDF
jgi:hypothetical protein